MPLSQVVALERSLAAAATIVEPRCFPSAYREIVPYVYLKIFIEI